MEFQALIRVRHRFNRALRFPLQSGKIDFSAPIGRIGTAAKNSKDSEGLTGQLLDKQKRAERVRVNLALYQLVPRAIACADQPHTRRKPAAGAEPAEEAAASTLAASFIAAPQVYRREISRQ